MLRSCDVIQYGVADYHVSPSVKSDKHSTRAVAIWLFPRTLFGCSSLDLTSNQLQQLPPGVFSSMTSLRSHLCGCMKWKVCMLGDENNLTYANVFFHLLFWHIYLHLFKIMEVSRLLYLMFVYIHNGVRLPKIYSPAWNKTGFQSIRCFDEHLIPLRRRLMFCSLKENWTSKGKQYSMFHGPACLYLLFLVLCCLRYLNIQGNQGLSCLPMELEQFRLLQNYYG